MNKCIFMGRTTADIEIKATAAGTNVATFNFAVNRKFKREGEADADFFNCVGFGLVADRLLKCNVQKGTKLLLTGEMQNNNYEKDGVKHYGMRFIVTDFDFCESKTSAGGNYSTEQENATQANFTPIDNNGDLPF